MAVEVLVQALDKIDQDRDRVLLKGISETELYRAALTVMMRLVFLFSAEERGLLLLGDALYDQYYAIELFSTEIQGYAEQILLNTSNILLDSNSINHLQELNAFNINYFAQWYFHNLEIYPQIQKYVEQLDHLRLLLIDYLRSSFHDELW